MWSVLGSMVRSRVHPPSSLKQLQDIPQEEWYNIPLQSIQNLHNSIPKKIQAVLQPKVTQLCINLLAPEFYI
jgi:hypothetical protein